MDFIRAGRHGALPGLTLAAALLLLWGAEPARDRSRAREVVLRPAGSEARALAAYARLPLTFVENAGQTDARVRYYGGGPGYGFYFTPQGVVFSFVRGSPPAEPRQVSARGESYAPGEPNPDPPAAEETVQGVALGLRFVGANPHPTLEGATPAPGTVNYLVGSDPARWRTGLATYEEVVYRELWPGIDMRVRGRGGELKYEFVLRPGARVEDIRLAYDGAQGLSLGPSGDLLIETVLGTLRDARPESYQAIGGKRVVVESRYVLVDAKGSTHGFMVAGYDPGYPLVIDPGLVYSTFLGGSFGEGGNSIALDTAGNAYVTGWARSPDFPTTPGAYDITFNGGRPGDAFVTKLNAAGSALVYSTFLGGGGSEEGKSIALDAAGSAYITGFTESPDFPTTPGAFDRGFGPGFFNAFVSKLNSAGSALVYSTFLGGAASEEGLSIALDAPGNAYVTGDTNSPDFPTTPGAFDRTFNGGSSDPFVTKLNTTGSALVYSTFLGGSAFDGGFSIALDAAGNAYLTGWADSPDFPTTPGAFDRTFNGGFTDPFVTKLNAAGSALVYSTFLGGSSDDFPGGVALDAAGNAYLTGLTSSFDFPTTPGAFDPTYNGSQDVFVTKLNAAGSAVVYSTFLGGSSIDSPGGVVLDAPGSAYITGFTQSPDFPTTLGAFDRTCGGRPPCGEFGPPDAFVTKLNTTGSALVYSTFLGGSSGEGGSSIALDTAGNAYLTGRTFSFDFPTTPGAFDPTFNGDIEDAFVTKLELRPVPSACGGQTSTIVGTDGDDNLIGTANADVISGESGDDHIEGRGGNDVICGNSGNDVIMGGDGDDRLFGQAGNDGIGGDLGDDLVDGGDADDTLEGGDGNDTLEGRSGFDRLDGGVGDDVIRGGLNFDVLFGGLGRDQLFGQQANDIVNGGAANDLVVGGDGNDRLGGQAGNDQLFGDDGDDRMDGGTDDDVCTGGPQVAGDTAVNCEVVNGVP